MRPELACLSLLRPEMSLYSLEPALEALSDAVRDSIKAAEEASTSGDEDYAEAIGEIETQRIEDLLGAIFVVCQAYIVRVYSLVRRLEVTAKLTSTDKAKALKLGAAHGATDLSSVAILDAVANYYKHRAEWPPGYWPQDKKSARTVSVISAIGLRPGSSRNLRYAAEALGNVDWCRYRIFHGYVLEWNRRVYSVYSDKLGDPKAPAPTPAAHNDTVPAATGGDGET